MSLDYVIKKIFFMLSNINRWVFLLSLLSLIWNITTINGLLQWIDVYPMDWWFEMWKKQKKRKQEWDVWCWIFFIYLFIFLKPKVSFLWNQNKIKERERKKKFSFWVSKLNKKKITFVVLPLCVHCGQFVTFPGFHW